MIDKVFTERIVKSGGVITTGEHVAKRWEANRKPAKTSLWDATEVIRPVPGNAPQSLRCALARELAFSYARIC